MLCEDFPCCGHYEPETGETYCREANMTTAERRIAAFTAEVYAEEAKAAKRAERALELEKAPAEHDFDGEGCDENPCKECLMEGWDQEAEWRASDHSDWDYSGNY